METGLNRLDVASLVDEESVSYLFFSMGKEIFGFPLGYVTEIVKPMPITTVPRSPQFVEGVINLRGKVLAVLQMRKMFGLPPVDLTDDSRFIVIQLQGFEAAIIVDSVSEVNKIESKNVEPAPLVVAGVEGKYLSGIAKQEEALLLLLDLPTIFAPWVHETPQP
ncbi:chemotaxis protein CheW [Brevibacillus daliensis]|uniref:chemotaxis protein CheW n=1 Tax=Brevibacillus daliensis TaxID=2892995 RepID=UPI001E42983D|nr:chemotaxis protein CheW [Brevibacillus daliensis]